MTIQTETAKKYKIKNCRVNIGTLLDENITKYIESIDINHQLQSESYLLSDISPSTSNLSVINSDGYFNSKALSKLPVKIEATFNNTSYVETFRGYLKKDSVKIKSKTVSLSSESYLQIFKKPITNKEVLENYFIEEIIERAFIETILDGTTYSITNTGIRIPICDLNEYTLWTDVLKLLCEASISVITYENSQFVFKPLYSDSSVSAYNFSTQNIQDLVLTKNNDSVKNSIIIESNYKSIAPKDKLTENVSNVTEIQNESYIIVAGTNNQIITVNKPLYKSVELVDGEYQYKTDTVVYITSDTNYGHKVNVSDINILTGVITLEESLTTGTTVSVTYKYQQLALLAGQQRTYTLELNNDSGATNIQIQCSAHKNVSEYDQGEEVPYSAIVAADKIHLVNTIEQKDNKIKFTLKNNTSQPVTISTLQLKGNPIKSFSPIKAKFKNQTSIDTYGENELTISNNFIVDELQAKEIGNFLYSNLASPVEKVELPSATFIPYLNVCDRVTVSEITTGINYDFLVTNIKHTLQENEWSTTVTAIKWPTSIPDITAEWLVKDQNGNYIPSALFNDKTPTAPNSLLVQYNTNIDTTYNLALSWQYLVDDLNPIDGFEVFVSVGSGTGVYTVSFEDDVHMMISSSARGLVLRNLPLKETIDSTDIYKTFGFAIRTFRNVHSTIDSTEMLYSIMTNFYTNYKILNSFTLYAGSDIESAISGTIEKSTIPIMDKLIKGLEKDKVYDSSLKFEDNRGLSVLYSGIRRVVVGQTGVGLYGLNIRDQNNNVALNADQTGITIGGLSLLNSGLTLEKTYSKYLFGIDGIKIQKKVASVWTDVFYADESGNLNIIGNLASGSIISNTSIVGGTITIGSSNSVFKADPSYGIWLGHSDYSSAPFRVSMGGSLYATNATITGSINCTSLFLNGTSITSGGGSSINGAYLTASSISNDKITSLDVGKLTAGNLTVTMTLTGGTIRTAASGKRLELKDNVLASYNSSNHYHGASIRLSDDQTSYYVAIHNDHTPIGAFGINQEDNDRLWLISWPGKKLKLQSGDDCSLQCPVGKTIYIGYSGATVKFQSGTTVDFTGTTTQGLGTTAVFG